MSIECILLRTALLMSECANDYYLLNQSYMLVSGQNSKLCRIAVTSRQAHASGWSSDRYTSLATVSKLDDEGKRPASTEHFNIQHRLLPRCVNHH